MWELKKIERASPQTGHVVQNDAMENAQGIIIEHVGDGRDGERYFTYRDGFISFKFSATRFDIDAQNLKDVYTVFLDSGLNSLKYRLSMDEVREIARNIKFVLLRWPLIPRERGRQPADVKFEIRRWYLWKTEYGEALP
jgi:hypothetical protein